MSAMWISVYSAGIAIRVADFFVTGRALICRRRFGVATRLVFISTHTAVVLKLGTT
jgi:hypothetical protein